MDFTEALLEIFSIPMDVLFEGYLDHHLHYLTALVSNALVLNN